MRGTYDEEELACFFLKKLVRFFCLLSFSGTGSLTLLSTNLLKTEGTLVGLGELAVSDVSDPMEECCVLPNTLFTELEESFLELELDA